MQSSVSESDYSPQSIISKLETDLRIEREERKQGASICLEGREGIRNSECTIE